MPNKHNHYVMQVSGRRLEVSRRLYDPLAGPKPEAGFPSDGCSTSPDTWWLRTVFSGAWVRAKLWPGCHIHDYHYREGPLAHNWGGRREADRVLRINVRRLMRAQGASRRKAERVAWLYWGRVRLWGASSYRHWDDGEQPLSKWHRFREAYGLFRAK